MISLVSYAATLALTLADPGLITLPFEKTLVSGENRHLSKRSLYGTVANADHYQYLANLSIGNPPQNVTVSVDTGSADLWVYAQGTEYAYDPSKSTSSSDLGQRFGVFYASGEYAGGEYYKDDVTWGEKSVPLQFGVVSQYSERTKHGVFGLGYKQLQALLEPYDIYPYAVPDAGYAETAAYSVNLGSYDSPEGSFLFGAVDKSRFIGDIVPQDQHTIDQDGTRYEVSTASVYGESFNVYFDTGTTVSMIPDHILDEYVNKTGATYNTTYGAYQAPDEIPDLSLTFEFQGVNITLPPSELWRPLVKGDPRILLSIVPSSQSGGLNILGDSFLRSAYVVWDLDHKKVGLAPVNPNPGEPDYQTIPKGGIEEL